MGLLDLPNEILILIAKKLGEKSLSHLVCTNHRLHTVLTERLHQLALQDKDEVPALFWAASNGHSALIELVLDQQYDVNEFLITRRRTPYTGEELEPLITYSTALQIAACNGHVDAVEILLQRGAHLNVPDTFGNTALITAIKGQADLAIIENLLDNGEMIDAIDSIFHRTAFFWALSDGKREAMQLLFDRGTNVDVVDLFCKTPLTCAIEMDRLDLVELLVGMGASVLDIQDSSGWAPLSHAVTSANLDVIRFFLRHGVNPDAIHPDAWLDKSDEVRALLKEVLLEHF